MPVKPKAEQRELLARKEGEHLTVDKYLAREPEIDCRIVDAAAALLRQHGFANVRMQDIGVAVGLSKAGLYHHCPSKEELLADIVRLCGELPAIQLQSVQERDGPPQDKLKAFVVSRMETILAHQDFFTVIWQERQFINRTASPTWRSEPRPIAAMSDNHQGSEERASCPFYRRSASSHARLGRHDRLGIPLVPRKRRREPTEIGLAFWILREVRPKWGDALAQLDSD
jgi:AcrR family transcriptional regulator